jgi:hypothetical protein
VPKKLLYTEFVSCRICSNFPATLAGKVRNNLATVLIIDNLNSSPYRELNIINEHKHDDGESETF